MFPKLKDVNIGQKVTVLKQYTDTEYVDGIVEKIFSTSENPNGIQVKLTNSEKGRVRKILQQPEINSNDNYFITTESGILEYKERFIVSPDENTGKDKITAFNIYKAIAAFANSEGGKLVIGISDDGRVLGLERDYLALKKINKSDGFHARDKDAFELKIREDCKKYFQNNPKYALDLIYKIEFPKIQGNKEICEIYVKATYDQPIVLFEKYCNINKFPKLYTLKNNSQNSKTIPFSDLKKFDHPNDSVQLFYVRKGNSSIKYEPDEFINFWIRRSQLISKMN